MPAPDPAHRTADDPGDEGFGLYVHWPWCLSKCPYCDFNSHALDATGAAGATQSPSPGQVRVGEGLRRQGPNGSGAATPPSHPPPSGGRRLFGAPNPDTDPARWAAAYRRELETLAADAPRRPLTSVFFGGGTPSLMDPSVVAAVLETAARLWPLAEDLEVTLEANPGAAERERFRAYRSAGVNRLSLGLQALDDAALRFLGRAHDRAAGLAALTHARETMDRVSCDLIYARPGQTPAAWAEELRALLAIAPDHVSLYQLTIEKGTPFFAAHRDGAFALPDEDTAADLFEMTGAVLTAAGLPAYEVSNHARPGAECRHNLVYWRGGDYLGVGPGAHGRVGRLATRTVAAPAGWLARVEADGHAVQARETLSAESRALEHLMMGLRLTEGIAAGRFQRLSGLALGEAVDPEALARLTDDGLLSWDGATLRATPAGLMRLDGVLADLVRLPASAA